MRPRSPLPRSSAPRLRRRPRGRRSASAAASRPNRSPTRIRPARARSATSRSSAKGFTGSSCDRPAGAAVQVDGSAAPEVRLGRGAHFVLIEVPHQGAARLVRADVGRARTERACPGSSVAAFTGPRRAVEGGRGPRPRVGTRRRPAAGGRRRRVAGVVARPGPAGGDGAGCALVRRRSPASRCWRSFTPGPSRRAPPRRRATTTATRCSTSGPSPGLDIKSSAIRCICSTRTFSSPSATRWPTRRRCWCRACSARRWCGSVRRRCSSTTCVLLAGFTLTGWATCLVAARWTGSWAAGAAAGIVAAFNAHMLTRLPHLQALHVEFLPLALAALDTLLRDPKPRHALKLALWFVLQALTSIYLLVFSAFAMVAAAAARPRDWTGRRFVPAAACLTLAAGVSVLVLWPYLQPYWQVHTEQGVARTLFDVELYSASWKDYLSTPSRVHYNAWSSPLVHRRGAVSGPDGDGPGGRRHCPRHRVAGSACANVPGGRRVRCTPVVRHQAAGLRDAVSPAAAAAGGASGVALRVSRHDGDRVPGRVRARRASPTIPMGAAAVGRRGTAGGARASNRWRRPFTSRRSPVSRRFTNRSRPNQTRSSSSCRCRAGSTGSATRGT